MAYMLAGVVGSSAARNWSKMQIYEALLSVVFLLIFGAFSYFASLSPQQGFGALNLVPQQCTSAGTLTNLAVCDLSSFDISAYGYFDVIYYVTFITGFTPGLSVNIFFPAGRQAAPQTSGTASPNLLPANQHPPVVAISDPAKDVTRLTMLPANAGICAAFNGMLGRAPVTFGTMKP